MGLIDALKNGKGEYTGNKAKNVKIEVGKGDANISVRGDNVDIKTGTGLQNVIVLGNDVNVELDKDAAKNWDLDADFDNVLVASDDGKKGNVKINTGSGNDLAYAVAKNVDIKMGEGEHVVSYWADNKANITVGNGNNDITTLDKFVQAGYLDQNTSMLGVNFGQAVEKALEASTIKSTETLYDITKTTTDKTGFLEKMQKTYNLDAANMKVLEQLYDNGSLNQTNGKTKYAIMESVKQKNADGSPKYVVCRIDGGETGGYVHSRGLIETKSATNKNGTYVVNGKYYTFSECIATKKSTNNSYTEDNKIVREIATRDVYEFNGAKEVNITTGSGNAGNIDITSTGNVNIKTKDVKNNDINVDSGKVYGATNIKREETITQGRTVKIGTNTTNTYTSPIVVDFNKDGKVSAKSGNGVDVDGNGIGDGYASEGDKMLAMSDKNKSGAIDGSEVFGDQTVSPFTGQKLNAANGFEALKMIAQEAEKYTGIKCLNNGEVNLLNLKSALGTVGVNLGFISDSNVTELEDLAHVASINVDEYDEVDADGNVQHRQLGSYTDASGQTYAANDVWFKNRTKIDNRLDRLNK